MSSAAYSTEFKELRTEDATLVDTGDDAIETGSHVTGSFVRER
jgi:hypothetical protein